MLWLKKKTPKPKIPAANRKHISTGAPSYNI